MLSVPSGYLDLFILYSLFKKKKKSWTSYTDEGLSFELKYLVADD